ncbi:putative MFS family arabinose efflux permease [Bradyrhizobium sp. AZCC 2262]|uniref:MFS transporter n=1 Tax=Bradyrhizobium sp. AZCC 2262 TaxID=3117022 RepID=UPI002FF36B76
MRSLKSGKKIIGVLVVVAIGQVIGWGTVGLLAVVGRQVAADLGMDISAVFAGNSIFYVATGLSAPVLAKAFIRFGARRVMIAGTFVAAPGFVLLSSSTGPASFFAAWVILGTAGSATLATATYILLNEIAGRRRAIGALMLVTGLASSVFWPTTSFLSDAMGWRGTCLVYAGLMVLVCLPLYAFGLPRRTERKEDVGSLGLPGEPHIVRKSTFYLIVSATVLCAFVTFGFGATMIELLKAEGLSPTQAVTFGSMLGVIQVSARGLDFLGGGRWDGITTALIAASTLVVAILLLMIGGGSHWMIATFILLYGLGSGALAVARATIPLVFYDNAEFAKATSRIALPLNLISAASPPILVGLLSNFGSNALLGFGMLCASAALLMLYWLSRHRPPIRRIAAS